MTADQEQSIRLELASASLCRGVTLRNAPAMTLGLLGLQASGLSEVVHGGCGTPP